MSVIICRWCFLSVQVVVMLAVAVILNASTITDESTNKASATQELHSTGVLLSTTSTALESPTGVLLSTTSTALELPTEIILTSDKLPSTTSIAVETHTESATSSSTASFTLLTSPSPPAPTTIMPTMSEATDATAATTVTTTATTTAPTTTTPIPPPDPPRDLTVSSVNPKGLDVWWTVSLNATHYLVYVNTTLSENVTGNNCNLRNLTGGSYYVIDVYACAQADVCSNATQGGNITYPSVPENLKLNDRSNSSFTISWTQYGLCSHFVVTVDYNDRYNVTTDIMTTPSSSDSNVTSVNCEIRGLQVAGGNYTVSIYAVFKHLESDVRNSSFLTKPNQPQNVASYGTNSTLDLAWDQLGVVEKFTWSVNDTTMAHGDTLTPLQNYTCYPCGSWRMQLNISNLPTAGAMYSIGIIANVSDVSSDPLTLLHSTVPNVPVDFSSKTENSQSIGLSWKRPNGDLQFYELFYYTDGSSKNENYTDVVATDVIHSLTGLLSDSYYTITLRSFSFGQHSDNETQSSWTVSDKVSEVKEVEGSAQETSVDVSWKPPPRKDNIRLYALNIAGPDGFQRNENMSCDGQNEIYCNNSDIISYTIKNLQHSTTYNITIAAVNPGGSSVPAGTGVTTHAETNNDWIAGVVIGCILGILLIIVIIFLILRWRQDKPPFKSKRHSPSTSFKGGEENPTYEEEPEPVAVDAFVDYAKKMSQDSNYLYACEYMLLTKLSAKNTNVAAELPDNRSKNRYTDILPFDNSRVKLIPDSDVAEGDCSDYINASYMPGFNSKREYIAAQGPMRSTVDDFWLMIWQQKVSMVVMVTNLSERGREKCEQYWPEDNEPLCYGNINVLLKSESLQDFYTIRVLEVSIESEKRQVTQYHFLTWPDFGVPEDMDHILTFVKDIRNSVMGSAPLLVHCSAGVGRTGTFIVVDHLLQLIKREQWIDLFHLVLDLRQHRPKMIQAESQYVFAHECIKMAIEKGLHRGSTLYIAEDDQANGDCLYANASETASEVPLYANASEIHEQSV